MRDILAGWLFCDWAGICVTKAGQLRILDLPYRSGHFGKIDLGTDFEKTASDTGTLSRHQESRVVDAVR
jgi:hypothetical protein